MKINIMEIDRDAEGYLKNFSQWNKYLAVEIAKIENIHMTKEHWIVVDFIRDFYIKFNTSPTIRMLVKAISIQYGEKFGSSSLLFRLFPGGPAKQATKIAGLPRSVKCL